MLSLPDRFREIEKLYSERPRGFTFLSPVTATAWAAYTRSGAESEATISGEARSYADTVGLLAIFRGETSIRQPFLGKSYSPLVELRSHADVEACNKVINELIRDQLANYPALASRACQLVGELHDNVPAHARGSGFSMAQYYGRSRVLELAVADCGHGMLRNVHAHESSITTHAQAIEWCLGEGHTTAESPDEWAQHLPEDAIGNPFEGAAEIRRETNHHVGLGLWKLQQIVAAANGSMGIWSGDSRLVTSRGRQRFVRAPFWRGVIVGLRLPIASNASFEGQSSLQELEALAERLQL